MRHPVGSECFGCRGQPSIGMGHQLRRRERLGRVSLGALGR
jgi:hypothetical protein